MASNKELEKQIAAYTESLGLEAIDTGGKTNAELAEAVKELKALAAESEAEERAAIAEKEAEAKEAEKKPPFYVAEGKAITCSKGVLADGDEVKAAYLGGGKDALNALVKAGHVKKG